MRTKRKFSAFLILFLIFSLPVLYFIFFIDPESSFYALGFAFSPLIGFFIILALAAYGLFTFLFLSKRRGALASLFILNILLLRFFDIRNLYFPLLVGAIFILIDLFLKKD